MTCEHTTSGCNYPEGGCNGDCARIPLQSTAKQCEYTGGECKRRACVAQCQAMQLTQSATDDKAGGNPVGYTDPSWLANPNGGHFSKRKGVCGNVPLYDRSQPQASQPSPAVELPVVAWKSGNEFLPFHPQASHVSPDYRSGWNDCFQAAQGAKS